MNTDKQKFLIEVSKLYYYDNLQQEEIARLYYSSRSTISRALDAARREGLVRIIIPEVGFDPRELEAQLRKTFNLSHVHVVPVNQSDDLINLQLTARSSAQFISQFIKPDDRIGLAWGSTLFELVRNLPSLSMPNLQIVQLIGNIDSAVVQSYAMNIVETASMHLGTTNAYTVMCPVMTESSLIRDILLHDSRINQVLSLGANCNKMFINLAPPTPESCLFRSGYMTTKEIENLRQNETVGSICCHFIDDNGDLSYPELDRRTIGVSLEDIERSDMVIACVSDPRKVKILHASLLKGYINVLMIDSISAKRLLEFHDMRLQSTALRKKKA